MLDNRHKVMLYCRVMDTSIERAVKAVGGQARLAAKVGVSINAVSLWVRGARRGKPIPAERVLQIERATGGAVTRHELRPDIYPVEFEPA